MSDKPMRLAILFEPRDMWIGVFWDATYMWRHYDRNECKLDEPERLFMVALRIYITIIPMFPLRISVDVPRVKNWFRSLRT